jgi:hypothetical protein
MVCFYSVPYMVLYIRETLLPNNRKRGKNSLENPQTKRSVQREEMAQNKARGQNHWF